MSTKSKPKQLPLFTIEHDEELEKHSAPTGETKLLAENMKQLEVGKGHIKIRAGKFTYEQASSIFGGAKAILKRESENETNVKLKGSAFKSKRHKNEAGKYDYLIIVRVS